jgi:retron-type reverse transcriptase
MATAAEEHGLLPWNQMGGRSKRSTTSGLGLLTACVKTAWKARPGSVVLVLSLDLKGAYDNVSHKRLLFILRRKRMPEWLVLFVRSFLTARRTRIAFAGHESDWIQTNTGIPQGSPISPILFLFVASEILESY